MVKLLFTQQFVRFLVVGGVSAALHWIARIMLSNWFPFSAALIIAYFIGMSIAFILNSLFVFPRSIKPIILQVRDFVFINILFLPVVWSLSIGLNHIMELVGIKNYSHEIAHAMAISAPIIVTFIFYKFVAFKDS